MRRRSRVKWLRANAQDVHSLGLNPGSKSCVATSDWIFVPHCPPGEEYNKKFRIVVSRIINKKHLGPSLACHSHLVITSSSWHRGNRLYRDSSGGRHLVSWSYWEKTNVTGPQYARKSMPQCVAHLRGAGTCSNWNLNIISLILLKLHNTIIRSVGEMVISFAHCRWCDWDSETSRFTNVTQLENSIGST